MVEEVLTPEDVDVTQEQILWRKEKEEEQEKDRQAHEEDDDPMPGMQAAQCRTQ